MPRLTKRTVDAAKPKQSDYVLWDSDLAGFGLRVRPSGAKSYIVQYRTAGGRSGVVRKVTLGRHGSPWTPDSARAKAWRILGTIANGADPAREKTEKRRDMTVADLCELYLAEGCITKKPSTLATDRGRIERHIKPLLGRKRVSEVSKVDVERFLGDVAAGKTKADLKTGKRGRAIVKGGRGTATRTVGLLGSVFSFASSRGLRPDNPAKGVKRFPDKKCERFLSAAEFARLGEELRAAEASDKNRKAVAIIRLLALTGARKSEIAALRWAEVDYEHSCLRLGNSKTDQKIIPLGAPAIDVLKKCAPEEGSPYVFPATRGNRWFQGHDKVWRQVREAAGFPDVRIHDLRHSFASVAVTGGNTLPFIGAILGHKDVKTTARYAHLADDPLKAAAKGISEDVAGAMHGVAAGSNVVRLIDRR